MPLSTERQTLLDQKGQALAQADKSLKEAQRILDDIGAQATEFRRQKAYHEANNDSTNANIVQGWISDLESKWGAQKQILDQATATYNAAKSDYDAFYASLTQEEKDVLAADSVAASAEANARTEQANQQVFMQKTTKYLIFGVAAIVIVALAAYALRNKF